MVTLDTMLNDPCFQKYTNLPSTPNPSNVPPIKDKKHKTMSPGLNRSSHGAAIIHILQRKKNDYQKSLARSTNEIRDLSYQTEKSSENISVLKDKINTYKQNVAFKNNEANFNLQKQEKTNSEEITKNSGYLQNQLNGGQKNFADTLRKIDCTKKENYRNGVNQMMLQTYDENNKNYSNVCYYQNPQSSVELRNRSNSNHEDQYYSQQQLQSDSNSNNNNHFEEIEQYISEKIDIKPICGFGDHMKFQDPMIEDRPVY